MIRQVVWFKFKDGVDTETRKRFISRLRQMVDKIDMIRRARIGTNLNEVEDAHHVALMVDLESEDALAAYNVHPDHQPVKEMAAELCVDITRGAYEVKPPPADAD